jgi:hypothetical protein
MVPRNKCANQSWIWQGINPAQALSPAPVSVKLSRAGVLRSQLPNGYFLRKTGRAIFLK